ncbi:MAG: hypothetical protein D3923_09195, partial [Candidatus Electrothrix sp. AR3]|nr:hypothetical protein [Candidatus Electrothrix sp. AR3]
GEKIGELGGTGGWNPHLHIESSMGWVELSGREVHPPINPQGNGIVYISNGPVTDDVLEVDIPPSSLITLDLVMPLRATKTNLSIPKSIFKSVISY